MSTVELGHEGLTPEEIEALNIDDGDTTATQGDLEEQAAAAAAAATAKEDDADAKNQDQGGDDAGAAAPADDGAAAAGKADDDQPAGAATEQGAAPSAQAYAPILVAQAPADADAKFKEIATKKADLRKRYDDGDVTFDEYEAEKDKLDEERLELKLQVDRANTAVALEEQRRKNQWDADCDTFLNANKDKYQGDDNKEAFEHLNETIKAFARMPMYANLTGPQLLDKAHRHVMAERGEPVAAPAAGGKANKRDIPKPTLPPSLAGVPSASATDPGEGKYASLDRLQTSNPEAYEAALAKMSEADRDAYLAS